MAKSFALISEGVSEYRIIKHILQHYCEEEPSITQIQPKISDNKQVGVGGWNEVIKFCSREEDLRNILEYNDYIVIQIDTDMCETAPYSVKRRIGERELSVDELYLSVRKRLLKEIPQTIDNTRILFAVCIDMIECWLLPIFETRKKSCATQNCLKRLNNCLKRNDIHIITDKNSEISRRSYSSILSFWKRRDDILISADHQWSLKRFLLELDSLC